MKNESKVIDGWEDLELPPLAKMIKLLENDIGLVSDDRKTILAFLSELRSYRAQRQANITQQHADRAQQKANRAQRHADRKELNR